jgi:putative transposase
LRRLIDPDHAELSVARQCALLGLARSTRYYHSVNDTTEDFQMMRLMDEWHMKWPFYGSRRMALLLRQEGYEANRKRVQRLMRLMGLEAIYPRQRTTVPHPEHRIYPYLLRHRTISRANQVWCADITYVPMAQGFMYLVAIMDWHSRYVLAWQLSNTMESDFCVKALRAALRRGRPDIFNTDQGSQFTSRAFTSVLESKGIAISMDGRGRALDNVFIERLWWSVKHENIYLQCYETAHDLRIGLEEYFEFYCCQRPHQALGNRTPWEAYRQDREKQQNLRR